MTTKTNTDLINQNDQNLGNLPVWDLSHMYNSIESKKIKSDLYFIETKSKEFEKKYEGKINLLDAQSLLLAIEKLEIIKELLNKPSQDTPNYVANYRAKDLQDWASYCSLDIKEHKNLDHRVSLKAS